MKLKTNNLLKVYYLGTSKKLLVGRLLYKERKFFFEYHNDFLSSGLEISPFKLPLRPNVFTSADSIFNGLFGLLNDSLPDGWNRMLIDRKLADLNIQPQSLTPIDRLGFVGYQGLGALAYEPHYDMATKLNWTHLDNINNHVQQILKHKNIEYLEELISLGGSLAGARPKILCNINNT